MSIFYGDPGRAGGTPSSFAGINQDFGILRNRLTPVSAVSTIQHNMFIIKVRALNLRELNEFALAGSP